jgi:hypothetical protein
MPKRKHPGEYEVGYGRPPQHSRFKPGQSGNPRGRPKGRQNLKTVLENILDQKVTVTENGRPKVMRKRELMLVAHVNKAVKGDVRALNSIIALMARTGLANVEVEQVEHEPAPEDQAILELFLQTQSPSIPDPELE